MNLVVDYGNTNAKVGIFEDHSLTEKKTFASDELLKEFLQKQEADHLLVSSVSTAADTVAAWAQHISKKIILNSTLPLPIKNLYGTPKTLGADRMAGACGAASLFPGKDVLVVDAGSCITFDVVNSQACYLGGSIAPGMNMRFESVHTFTANLPLVRPVENPTLIGTSTESCIQSGIINGMVAEMNGLIRLYSEKYEDLQVILCGGDARFFENKLKASIFASPDLVLIGLNSILSHNVRL
jgi:type III pantothenate kinase